MNIVSGSHIMLTKETIEKRLAELGYSRAPDSWLYADEYKIGDRYIYVSPLKRQHSVLVIDRPTYNLLLKRQIDGVILEKRSKKMLILSILAKRTHPAAT